MILEPTSSSEVAMKTLTTTSEQIFASCLRPNAGETAWLNARRGAAAAINSVARSELPFAEHYWRDVLPESFGSTAGTPLINGSAGEHHTRR
jgi:hypothetical protein